MAVLGLAVPLAVGPAAVALPGDRPSPAASVTPEPSAVAAEPGAEPGAGSEAGSEAEPAEEPSAEPSSAVAPVPEAADASATATAGTAAASASSSSSSSAIVPAGAPGWQRTGHPRSGTSQAGWQQRRQRHHPGSAPERAGQVPEQVPEQAVEQSPDQPVEQLPEQPAATAADPTAADPAADAPAPGGPADGSGSEALALGLPGPQTVAAGPVVLPTRWDDASTRQFPLGAGLGLIGCGLGLIGLRLRRG
ncbi:hypothetical protein ACFVUH_08945 [Kitasatospora sp. NPDC058032]|uniref:hypothetical protein n=1 Tax=Kitasatospora sp. NPDC058032 TaxID=3346307 RepID=UPI0036DD3EE8